MKKLFLVLYVFLTLHFYAQIPGIDPRQFNTGTNAAYTGVLLNGVADLNWDVRSRTTSTGAWSGYTDAIVISNGSAPGPWLRSPWPNCNWISTNTPGNANTTVNIYQYRYRVNLPENDICGNPISSSMSIDMDFYADNCIRNVWVNGVAQTFTQINNLPVFNGFGITCYGDFSTVARLKLNNGWASGLNEIVVEVWDDAVAPGVGGRTGFLAQLNPNSRTIGNPKPMPSVGFDLFSEIRTKEKEVCANNMEAIYLAFAEKAKTIVKGVKWQESNDGGQSWIDIAGGDGYVFSFNNNLGAGEYIYRILITQSGDFDNENCVTISESIKLRVVECCEDPCSWSKTGNDNINSGHFLGTRNNTDLNFRTNNSLNMKLGVSGHLTLNEGKSLMFGKITSNSTDNRWGIEEFDGGLNFWKPWPTPNSGNYNMFLSNDGKVGIQIGNTPLWGKALGWNWEKFQVRGWGLSDGWATFSDERLKKNFRKIEKPTQTLMAIKAYQYDYNTEQFDNQSVNSDKVENKQKMAEINGLTKRYGFKAQEVEKILPDLVHNPTSKEGFKSMDYDGFIPILIEAFKELNAKVEKQNNALVENEELKAKIAVMEEKFALLEKTITQLCESGCEGLKKVGSSSDVDVLFQSIPNPTDSEALINYHLTREYRDASITVSSQDGKQLMSVKLDTKKGAGSVKINLGDLANGTYLYTLVAGERVIDTKRLQIIK